jgi:hypothetical protein
MGVLDDFESVRNQLLNCSPLPTVNQVVNDLVREETRLKSHRPSQPHTTVLTTPTSVDPTVTAPPKGHDKRQSNQKNLILFVPFASIAVTLLINVTCVPAFFSVLQPWLPLSLYHHPMLHLLILSH